MLKALRIILVIQLLLGAIWTVAMLTEMQRSLASLAVAAGILGVALGFALPKKAVRILPNAIFRNRSLNILVTTLMALAWLLPLAAIIWLAQYGETSGAGGGQGSPGVLLGCGVLAWRLSQAG